MSEKIRLKGGQKFELIPLGITTDDVKKRRIFKFISDLSYEEIKIAFSNTYNIGEIDILSEDGTASKSFLDCVAFKSLLFTSNYEIYDNTTKDIYTVELSVDAIEKELQTANTKIIDLCNTIVTISML